MSILNTKTLKMFVAVADTLNFRQAAEQLHTSQPPLSRAVREMEERLGVVLFFRNTHGVSITAAGSELLPKAKLILGLLDDAERGLRQHHAPRALRLGLTSSVEPGLFETIVQLLSHQFGAATLKVSYATSPKLITQLRAKRLDAALIALPTMTYELEVESVATQSMIVALPSNNQLARRRVLSLADISHEPVFWFERSRQPVFFDHCHDVFNKNHFSPHFLPEPQEHHILLGDIAAGKGIALLPESFSALRRNGVSYRKLREGNELAMQIGVVTGAVEHHVAEYLKQAVRRGLQK
jgi:DNA-binding transcriptional LysR family regulator